MKHLGFRMWGFLGLESFGALGVLILGFGGFGVVGVWGFRVWGYEELQNLPTLRKHMASRFQGLQLNMLTLNLKPETPNPKPGTRSLNPPLKTSGSCTQEDAFGPLKWS